MPLFVVTGPLLAFYEAEGDIFADELRPRVALFRPLFPTFSFGFHVPSFGAFRWPTGCACHCVKLKSMMAVGEHRTLLPPKWWRWERIKFRPGRRSSSADSDYS